MHDIHESILLLGHGATPASALLDQTGYTVRHATDNTEAIRSIAALPPDLVVLDAGASPEDITATCHALRSQAAESDLPILILSDCTAPNLMMRTIEELGAVDFIAKPFQPQELLARIRLHLTMRSQGQLNRLYLDHLEDLVEQRTHELLRDNLFQEALNKLLGLSLASLSTTTTLNHALDILLALPWAKEGASAGIFLAQDDDSYHLAASRGSRSIQPHMCPHIGNGPTPGLTCLRCGEVLHIINSPGEASDKTAVEHQEACVPLMQDNTFLGALTIIMDAPHSFDAPEREFLIHASQTIANILRHKDSEEQLLFQAYFDPLTGLPNRTNLVRTINSHIGHLAPGLSPVLCMLDLAQFKLVNESLGHPTGDAVIRAAAERLRSFKAYGMVPARIGGDVFAAFLPQVEDKARAISIAREIQRRFASPFPVTDDGIYLSSYIGIAIGAGESMDGESLVRDADTALHKAKQDGPGRHAVFSSAMHISAQRFMRLANDLRRALDNDELVLHYQPLVELASGRIRGAEALVRWNHPDLGMLPPDEFISVAEKTGLIVPLGLFVLRRACEQYAALRDKAAPDGDFTMSVNLSGVQLSCTTLADDIATILRETNVPPHALKLEITETAAMTSPDHARELFTKLRQQGITIAIDDFGTGYSSLSHLHSFPVDTLKIDRSFVSGLADAHNTTPIIRAVVALGHSLGMSIIAEGVEGADQRELLSGLRCEYGQGFFFSRPVPFEKFGE